MKQLKYKHQWRAAEAIQRYLAAGLLHCWYRSAFSETILVVRRAK